MEESVQTAVKERRSKASEIITSGHIPTAVWYLAWPTIINTLIQTAYHIINRMFMGHVGDQAPQSLAAVGIGGMVLMSQFAVMFGLSAGAQALISRFLGGEGYDDADEAAGQSLVLSLIVGLVTMGPLIALASPIAGLAGAKGPVVGLTASYMAIIGWFSIPSVLYMTMTSALRSAGDVRTPLYAGGIVIGSNILLDWLLIFGVGPIPALGVKGAAIATGVSRIVGMVLMFWFLHRSVIRRAFHHLLPHPIWFWRIMNIGWPAMVQNLLWSTGFLAYIRIISQLPNAVYAQASLTVAVSIEMLCFMPGVAYSIAAGPLVGQNLGAGRAKRAAKCAWVATGQAAAVMTAVAIVLVAIPGQLAHLFTNKEPVVALIVSYLRINAFGEPFLAVGMVLAGALQGAGDTRMPTWIEFLINWVIRLPLAWVLAITFHLGVIGAWIALLATTVMYGFLVAGWFQTGRWRSIKV